jgi:hypothetical protein
MSAADTRSNGWRPRKRLEQDSPMRMSLTGVIGSRLPPPETRDRQSGWMFLVRSRPGPRGIPAEPKIQVAGVPSH